MEFQKRRPKNMQNVKEQYIWERYKRKFPNSTQDEFLKNIEKYNKLKAFPANGNFFETNQEITPEIHYLMRLLTQWYLTKAFESMLIDLNDPNVWECLEEGNIGTPARLAKVWVGGTIDDDSEMGSGRFMKPVRLAKFPNTVNTQNPIYGDLVENCVKSKIPITKRISIVSNCSHHLAPFSTLFDEDSYALVSYIPNKFVLGISKLQRLADYVCRRFWLQEDLTKALYEEVCKAAETKDVYVGLFNVKHTCEWLRGAKNPEGGFTSEFYSGAFENSDLRAQVK